MGIILKRDYIVNIHFEESKEVKQLYVMQTMFEKVSLRQLDESISDIIQILHANGCSITCAQVTLASTNEPLTNRMFLSLKDIPEPVTSGVFTPNCPTGYTDCESCGYWHGEISECEYN